MIATVCAIDCETKQHYMFKPLIEGLCVSREMLAIRLRDLGILDAATVEYHKTYALPNKWRPVSKSSPMQHVMQQIWNELGSRGS